MIVLADVVDWEALGDVVIASLVAGVWLTLCFSVAILGVTRAAERRRAEHTVGAVVYGALGLFGLAASLAGVAAAIIVMTTKG